MNRDRRNGRKMGLIAVASAMLLLPIVGSACAQSLMRTPTIRIEPRVPVGPRINPNIAARVGSTAAARNGVGITARVGVSVAARTPPSPPAVPPSIGRGPPPPRIVTIPHLGSTLPYVRFPPNLYPVCEDAYRGRDGACYDQPVALSDGGRGKANGRQSGVRTGGNGSRVAIDRMTVPNELVAEIDGALTDAQADDLARRHGLRRIASQNIPLIDATIGLFRVADNRPIDVARGEFAGDGSVRSVQPNYRYVLQDQSAAPSEGDPAQYALAQLRLPQAHALARGANVLVAVIDSGIDITHPELANSIAGSFDALGSKEGPHFHGTGVAGAIAAHVKLAGSAPDARILAIRAFGAATSGAESTSYVIIKSLDYAVQHEAKIVNMSFAGPKDALIARGVTKAASRGLLLIGAAGNAGPKSPPLYPAAYPEVIAVSGTDAKDEVFTASNRGDYIALAAPGEDILMPAPDGKYQMRSGTSFSAALISGIAALVRQRNPALTANEIRALLTRTARDIGAPGRDDLFGYGEADAFAAVTAAGSAPSDAVAAVSDKTSQSSNASEDNNTSVSRGLNNAAPSVASDKSAANDANPPASR